MSDESWLTGSSPKTHSSPPSTDSPERPAPGPNPPAAPAARSEADFSVEELLGHLETDRPANEPNGNNIFQDNDSYLFGILNPLGDPIDLLGHTIDSALGTTRPAPNANLAVAGPSTEPQNTAQELDALWNTLMQGDFQSQPGADQLQQGTSGMDAEGQGLWEEIMQIANRPDAAVGTNLGQNPDMEDDYAPFLDIPSPQPDIAVPAITINQPTPETTRTMPASSNLLQRALRNPHGNTDPNLQSTTGSGGLQITGPDQFLLPELPNLSTSIPDHESVSDDMEDFDHFDDLFEGPESSPKGSPLPAATSPRRTAPAHTSPPPNIQSSPERSDSSRSDNGQFDALFDGEEEEDAVPSREPTPPPRSPPRHTSPIRRGVPLRNATRIPSPPRPSGRIQLALPPRPSGRGSVITPAAASPAIASRPPRRACSPLPQGSLPAAAAPAAAPLPPSRAASHLFMPPVGRGGTTQTGTRRTRRSRTPVTRQTTAQAPSNSPLPSPPAPAASDSPSTSAVIAPNPSAPATTASVQTHLDPALTGTAAPVQTHLDPALTVTVAPAPAAPARVTSAKAPTKTTSCPLDGCFKIFTTPHLPRHLESKVHANDDRTPKPCKFCDKPISFVDIPSHLRLAHREIMTRINRGENFKDIGRDEAACNRINPRSRAGPSATRANIPAVQQGTASRAGPSATPANIPAAQQGTASADILVPGSHTDDILVPDIHALDIPVPGSYGHEFDIPVPSHQGPVASTSRLPNQTRNTSNQPPAHKKGKKAASGSKTNTKGKGKGKGKGAARATQEEDTTDEDSHDDEDSTDDEDKTGKDKGEKRKYSGDRYMCHICGDYRSKKNRRIHLRSTHKVVPPGEPGASACTPCLEETCDKTVAQPGDMQRHLRLMHPGSRHIVEYKPRKRKNQSNDDDGEDDIDVDDANSGQGPSNPKKKKANPGKGPPKPKKKKK
ncbi:hypothetical protein MJO28_000678 [Puccinia striiformis f. sp. tritici]|uniref:Uncharacterized protein n=1 Tax=Puccinia striiformis f. sp. tritici TaxID=168172 RepID=A0ACC0F0K1_9BASI|nr:hypothetical protein MJO28_000678 [Puccinia striiformis f. sp. tritici]